MAQPTCYILVGFPGTGKTTYFQQQLAAECAHISSDRIIEEWAAEAGKTYSEVWADCIGRAATRSKMDFITALNKRQSIAYDQTNLSDKKRKEILAALPEEYRKVCVYFRVVDQNVLRERLDARAANGKRISEKVISDMQKRFIAPHPIEGFDEVIVLDSCISGVVDDNG